MSVIDNDYQTSLLFKQFTGVAATQLDQQFSNEPYRSIQNIFSRDIFIEEVPAQAPISISTLDNSGSWADSVGALPSVNTPSSNTFAQIYPDSHLEFYKNVELSAVPGSNSRVWYKLDAGNNNLVKDTINFKFDDVNSTYLMRVKYNNGATYINNPINSFPLFWVLDNQSGYLQFYSTTVQLASNANIPTNPPKMSFIKYVGKKGLLNLDISGQQQVVDISSLDVDVSGIQANLYNINRMILPDGYVDISGGAPWDLCGNEAVRTYYTYNRSNMFVGYESLPVLDGSAVDHSFDPSHNGVLYELDVSGRLYVSSNTQLDDVSCNDLDVSGNLVVLGHTQLDDVSCNNLDVSGNLVVLGHTQLEDVSCNNLDVSGNLVVLGHTQLEDVSCNNLDVSGNLVVLGHTQLEDVSCNNLDVSGDLVVLGHTQLDDVSCNNLDVSGNLYMNCNYIVDVSNVYFCNDTAILGESAGVLTLSGDLDMSANQIITIADATDGSGVPSWGQVQTAINDLSGSIVGSYWTQTGNDIYYSLGNVGIGTATPSERLEVIGNAVIDGTLDMCCNDIIDVSNIRFCNNTSILGASAGVLTVSGDIDMSANQIITIADATDSSGVPSWGQVQTAINDLSGSIGGGYWTQTGSDIYYNTGNVGIGNATPAQKLDVNGSANIAENVFVAMNATQSSIVTDKNLYARNTNLIDTLKIGYDTFYNRIWNLMIVANENGVYTNPITGITQTLSTPNTGKPNAVPTFSSAWGPCVIPIAYLDINQNYAPTPFAPAGAQTFQTAFRPDMANTTAYFTIKFSEPYDAPDSSSLGVDWKIATLYKQYGGTMKSGIAAITEQTVTFMVGYIDSYQLSAPSGGSADKRNPKPFIKVISTNIGNLKCLTGITVMPNNVDPADIDALTQNMKYYGFDIETPKIGGICRIIVAESCPGLPADKNIQNKAWVLLEQQWNVEPWQQQAGVDNTQILAALINQHVISVRMYSNNLGDLNASRSPPVANEYNTDWQLVTEKQIQENGIYSWDKFVLPMGAVASGGYATPQVFNTPTSPPVSDISFTLMVGGTPCPNPLTGILDYAYPTIVDGANLWEVWLNLKNWTYGITTTEEVFENDVDICGNVTIDGVTTAQAVTATDITCNNLDALNSIDVGPSQKLTITENKILSTTPAANPLGGLEMETNNIYMKFANWSSAGGTIPAGLNIQLGDATSNTGMRIRDDSSTPLFQVEGSGLGQTQALQPWTDMCYNLGYKDNNPFQNKRYKDLYVGGIDTSGNIDVSGDLHIDGTIDVSGGADLSGNLSVTGTVDIDGRLTIVDLSATNVDVSNDLNVEGLINGVADTTFVEYRDFSSDIPAGAADAWHCIATCSGSLDNARGLFIIDDDTSGIREQTVFYAGTSYARGNYINVLAHNWYVSSGPLMTNLKIDVSGNQPTPIDPAIYAGANLYVYRETSANTSDIHVRLYQNGRDPSTGGRWALGSTPIFDLSTTAVDLDVTYNPGNGRANACSSLNHSFQGDVSMSTLELNQLSLNGAVITTNASSVSATAPYAWGTRYIEQVDASDAYLVGSYKQIRSGFITGNVQDTLSFGPPTGGLPVATYGGIVGTLLPLNSSVVWDIPTANFNGTENWFSIPDMVSRTKMTISIQFGVSWGYGGVTPSPYEIISVWWIGKNNSPTFKRIATVERSYNINAPSATSTYIYNATVTLVGGDSTTNVDFVSGDTFYFTAQQSGTASALGTFVNETRVNITWEALN